MQESMELLEWCDVSLGQPYMVFHAVMDDIVVAAMVRMMILPVVVVVIVVFS